LYSKSEKGYDTGRAGDFDGWRSSLGWLHLRSIQRGARRTILSDFVAAIVSLAVLAGVGLATAGERSPLRVGDPLPQLDLLDIQGERIGSEVYRDRVQVVTFADRESAESLKRWMGDAQVRATRAHPDLPVVYMSFADLTAVPRFMRGMVGPLLRRSFETSNEELTASYRKVGIESDPARVAFRFIPDWDGAYLEAFGLESAASYHGWIVAGGRVVVAFDASTPNVVDRYVESFDRLDPKTDGARAEP
jgi:hypothetical protein